MDVWTDINSAANDIRETKETIQATAKTMVALEIGIGILSVIILILILNKK